MKKIALFILIAFVAFACSKEKSVSLSGKITNPESEIIIIQISTNEQIDTVAINEDGTFSTSFKLVEEHLANLRSGNIRLPINLVPGADINFQLDTEDFKNGSMANSKITGEGSETSAFMYKLKVKLNSYSTQELLKMPVDQFVKTMDQTETSYNEELDKFKIESAPSEKFIERMNLRQKVDMASKYNYFIMYHARYAPDDKTPIPDSFQAYIDEIQLNDIENIKEVSEYKNFVVSGHSTNIAEKLKEEGFERGTIKYVNKNADEIIALNAPQEIKDKLGNSMVSSYTYMPDSIQKIFKSRYKELIKNQDYLDVFEATLAIVEKTKPGELAPSFNYPNIKGEMVSSESLKGKVIYIDVWATWCGPCKGEIPHLKKMESEMHNEDVAFVSISVDTDKEAWEEMVKEKELGGFQLYAKEAWGCDIVKNYAIRGIPRFIIVDKEGKIVEASASRPSNPETKAKLLKLAKS